MDADAGCDGAIVRDLPHAVDLLALHRRWPERYPLLLESVADGTPRSRWDLLLVADGQGIVAGPNGVRTLDGDALDGGFLDALDAAWRRQRAPVTQPSVADGGSAVGDMASNAAAPAHARATAPTEPHPAWPFAGGWALYLGYELAADIESSLRLPAPDTGAIPTAVALRCPAALLRDRERGTLVAIAEPDHEAMLMAIAEDVDAAFSAAPTANVWTPPCAIDEDEPQRFLDGVERIHEHIRVGDTFQVNLSRQWRARFHEPPPAGALYARLRAANPAPFAASFIQPGWALASSSPERLLSVRGGIAQTRPIAGTRPRGGGDDDQARMRELIAHPKERAEHVMLIDLERNDLGRVCVPGSVQVDELMVVESYAHVHHIVSNVRGRLRADVTPGQAIAAVFPGGTITGAPKVRCMQIIAALEGIGRGEYTGAIGYLDRSGDLDLNILIRTLRQVGDTVSFRAGAGIVADSVAALELDETRAKARGMLRALGVDA